MKNEEHGIIFIHKLMFTVNCAGLQESDIHIMRVCVCVCVRVCERVQYIHTYVR